MKIKTPINNFAMRAFTLMVLALYLVSFSGCQKEDVYLDTFKPELLILADNSILSANEIKFSKDTVYTLGTNIVRKAGQKLTIDAGTLIKVKNKLSIIIEKGGILEAEGLKDAPIVFTSYAAKGTAGIIGSDGSGTNYWYGIRIYGDAGQTVISASKLSYVRIEFAGGDENYAGLSPLYLENVSNLTSIHHVQVSYSFGTPSFGFSGGNCNASYLVSYASNANDFSFENGYRGQLQFLLAYRHPYFPVIQPGSNLAGFFITGSATLPIMSNITVIGPGNRKGNSATYAERDPSAAVLISSGARFRIRNSAFMGFPKSAIYMNDGNSARALNFGNSELSYSLSQSTDSSKTFYLPKGVYPPFTSIDFKNFMLEPRFFNRVLLTTDDFMLADPFDYDVSPDPMPLPGSPLFSGADFSGIYDDIFFTRVIFKGALGDENWLDGWVNFTPLQTSYNY